MFVCSGSNLAALGRAVLPRALAVHPVLAQALRLLLLWRVRTRGWPKLPLRSQRLLLQLLTRQLLRRPCLACSVPLRPMVVRCEGQPEATALAAILGAASAAAQAPLWSDSLLLAALLLV